MDDRERLILIARAKQKQAQAAKPQTNLVEQTGTGTSEGIANMAGFPVDMATKGLNMIPGVDIQNPVGGSESIKGLLSPFMSEAEPQTAGQRIGRRVGQDVGAGAVAGPLAGVSSLAGMGLNAASDVASGLAGGATSEVTDNPSINMIVSLLAGGAPIAAAKAGRPSGAPSMDELKASEKKAYKAIKESPVRLSPDQTQELQGNVSARMYDEDMDAPLHPAAARGVNRAYDMQARSPEGAPSLGEVENVRKFINKNVVKSAAPEERRLGKAMKSEIDAYLAKNVPEEANVSSVAHELSRRRINSEDLSKQFEKANWRAASTGLGGNDINAVRQNVRKLVEKDGGSYTKAEREALLDIVNGTKATNTARFVGGFAPQRGAFGLAGSMAQAGAGVYTGNVAWAAPAGVGMAAQAIGEALTRRQVAKVSELLRAGKPVPKTFTEGEKAVTKALLAIQAAQQGPQ